MWYSTKVAELLKIDYSILQGPFGGNFSSVELVASVSNVGSINCAPDSYHLKMINFLSK